MVSPTHVVLDGLQEPSHGRGLSAHWAMAGFENAVDVAGQAGWLRVVDANAEAAGGADEEASNTGRAADAPAVTRAVTEEDMVHAAGIARAFGIELRDRAGVAFRCDNELPALREQITREYRARFAQSLVFGLPALVVHYLGPMLASGGGQSAASMAMPWLLEGALVGWAIWVAALPIIWQGGCAAIHFRATADLFTAALIALAYLPSLAGTASLLFTSSPWFGLPGAGDGGAGDALERGAMAGPAFHIAIMATMVASFQRWQLHRSAHRLSGRADLLLPRFGVLILAWLAAMLVTMALVGWQVGLCLGLLLPPMLSAGGVNRWSPGWSIALPVLAFAPLFLFGPKAITFAPHAAAMRFEIAAGFAWMMSLTLALGWRKMGK